VSGICGIVDFSGRPVTAAELEPMVAAAPYRGRDGVTSWTGAQAALSHQALHSTPASRAERQPWHAQGGDLIVVADARIDDRDALSARLRDHVGPSVGRQTSTDVDLLAEAFRAWGPSGVGRIVGDFAFAAWDAKRRSLFAARDAMGMRPLAYHWNGSRLWFASEVQQVVAADGVPARLFDEALAAHLVGRFEHHAWTPYRDVFRVPPGHALTVTSSGVRLERYWDVDAAARVRFRSERAYADAFRDLFETAVRDRLQSIGDVGMLLSGGLDSGAVAAMAGHVAQRDGVDTKGIRTYSWQSHELPEVDERHISDQIVAHFGYSSAPVSADAHGPLSDFPEHGPDRSGPFAGVYQPMIATALAQAAADGVTVTLSGSRGDLLVGEAVFDAPGLLFSGRWRALSRDLRAYRRWRNGSLSAAMGQLLVRPILADVLAVPLLAPLRRARQRVRPSKPVRLPPWATDALAAAAEGHTERPESMQGASVDLRGTSRRSRHRMVFLGMNAEAMVWIERLHAQAGIGFVDPWSDRRLAEFVIASPQWVIQRFTEPKRIAREAMRGVMPEAVRTSVGKRSPEPLYLRALRERAVAVVDSLLTEPAIADLGLVDARALREHHAQVKAGAAPLPTFWWALTLEMWLRRFLPM